MNSLISPYGEKLVDLTVSNNQLSAGAEELQSIQLTERQLCDLELLATGAFSPLDGFMGQADYFSVLKNLRLANGYIFPIPITLPTDNIQNFKEGQEIVLRDSRNRILALMEIAEIYLWDRKEFSSKILGTIDSRHPLVSEMSRWGKFNIAGKLRVLNLPKRPDFQSLRLTPEQTREKLNAINSGNVVAFQTRNPLHRAHETMVKRAISQIGGTLLLHPVVGMTKAGDIDYHTRVRTYKALIDGHFAPGEVLLSLLPLAMRFAGPREAVWHALIRRNYGANHFIVGRDHASPGSDSSGDPFYRSAAAREIAEEYSKELGVNILKFDEFVYLPDKEEYEEVSKIPKETRTFSLSGTKVRDEYLKNGTPLPTWFTHKEVAKILTESSAIQQSKGVCLWFTGLSGSGKSTTAEMLETLLLEKGRQVSLLDGDVVRTNLSKGLGFSPDDRDINVRRIGFVAGEIVKHGGLVICAAISPYRATRDDIRNLIGDEQFIEIFVETPIEVCEARDVKGMYALAKKGIIKDFTGISAPYEKPINPEIILDTVNNSGDQNSLLIMDHLRDKGFLSR